MKDISSTMTKSTMNQEHKCRLISTQSYPSGLVQLKYEVAHDG